MVIHSNIYGNKNFELQITWWKNFSHFFQFNIDWSTRSDHAGLEIFLEIYKLYICAQICDCRHWDYKNNKWKNVHDDIEND